MIFLEHATTGDGELTALQFLSLLHSAGVPASRLVADCRQYPQVLVNVAVTDNAQKRSIMASEALRAAVAGAGGGVGGEWPCTGASLRTEALIRVMVEAQSEETAQTSAELLANVIKRL